MRKLSSAFFWVGIIVLAAAVICGITFAVKAETGSFLTFIYWAVGGGLFFMLALSQAFLLDAVADIQGRMAEDRKRDEIRKPVSPSVPLPTPVASSTPPQQTRGTDRMYVAGDGLIVCPQCGQRQRANRIICLNCGTKFQGVE